MTILDDVADIAAGRSGARRLNDETICVADPRSARAILHNRHGRFAEHSDFFTTRAGTLQPRSRQQAIAREARTLLARRLAEADIEGAVGLLSHQSAWPRAGCSMMAMIGMPSLAAPQRSENLHRLLNEIVEHRILARGETKKWKFSALGRKKRLERAFAAERDRCDADDILSIVARHGTDAPVGQLVEVYLGFLFSMISSVGMALGWSVWLALYHGKQDAPAAWIALEALRLYPVAWWMERHAARSQELFGIAVEAGTPVIICPYAVHRDPDQWEKPNDFLPERWDGRADRSGWMPFGAGPHACPAMGLSLSLIERFLTELFRLPCSAKSLNGTAPQLGAALAPPRFMLMRGG